MASGVFGVDSPSLQGSDLPREIILSQLNQIVASKQFRSSRHYPAFLKYVVEQALAGNINQLKERMIGVDVFGRDPAYDTSQDPVVRTSACEVRKRLAHFYEGSEAYQVRIELPTGSYVPEFHFPESEAQELTAAQETPAPPPEREAITAPRSKAWMITAGVLLGALLMTGAVAGFLRLQKTTLERFWAPVWDGAQPVLLCVSDFTRPQDSVSGQNPNSADSAGSDRLAFADAVTMARVAGAIQAHGSRYEIRSVENATFEDFRKGPVVLIGGFNNPWTLRMDENQRFTFERDAQGKFFIRDAQSPSEIKWQYSGTAAEPPSQDFAVVSRFLDRATETMVVVVAGMGKAGTVAAGEFVTESRYLDTLAHQAPSGWEQKNIQVVIGTDVVNGAPGAPRILAVHAW